MNRLRRGLVTGLVPAVVALLVSLVVLAIVLALLGVDPVKSLKALFDFGPTPRAESNQVRTWINRSVPLFLSGLAVSVGFRMNLFNIGVEGQYSVAAVVAAAAGAMVHLPQALHIAFILLVAMAAGAAYASVAGRPEGQARRQRGHHHDHAQQHRGGADRLPAARTAARPGPAQERQPLDAAAAGVGVVPGVPVRLRDLRAAAAQP